ncbi:hypothetical protein TYRP_012830 [Tyrophagus putrescentiae]|nr:hypothetical protein TYRP_012830 [Tyrophagus putrescentiae]
MNNRSLGNLSNLSSINSRRSRKMDSDLWDIVFGAFLAAQSSFRYKSSSSDYSFDILAHSLRHTAVSALLCG